MSLSSRLNGVVVVITGASSGLGEATARYLAAHGAQVVLGARRADRLASIVSDIEADGGRAAFQTTDVTDQKQVKSLIDFAQSRFGKLDVLVNNAGLMAVAPLDELKVDEWESMIDINIKGVLYGICAALPVFRSQGFGHFINISSLAGIKVFSPGGVVYSGTKSAVRSISEGLRQEVGENIRTTIISPGMIDSDLKLGTTHKPSAEALREFYRIAIPSSSVAHAIAFAIEQPSDVDINEIVLRPTGQDF